MIYTLVALDVTGIQTYLFGSNRLVENIGASEIVAQVTEQWIFEIAKELKFRHNFVFDDEFDYSLDNWFDETKCLKLQSVELEVMFVGGGNAVLMFGDLEQAQTFVKALTERLLTMAPGLNVVVEFIACNMKQQILKDIYDELWDNLAQKKNQPTPSIPLLGVGVNAVCGSTGLPAVSVDKDDRRRLLSAETQAKLNFVKMANKRMRDIFLSNNNYEFENDFNLIGEKIKANYLAIVHADGNGIGSWLKQQTGGCTTAADNDRFIQIHRDCSQKLRQIAFHAMQTVVDAVIARGDFAREFKWLRLRPLVVGGDDTTFVCEGKLGLSLAAIYLKAFRAKAQALDTNLHACAGVAIVHQHYPFARGYQLSEQLIKAAKGYVRQETDDDESFSAIDWHFAINGLIGELNDIRDQEYRIPLNDEMLSLSLRPLQLTTEDDEELRQWQNVRQLILAFQSDEWQKKRNKLKTLRERLRDGKMATQQYLKSYKLGKLPRLATGSTNDLDSLQESGYLRNSPQCGYFDAIEAADHFIDLEGEADGD